MGRKKNVQPPNFRPSASCGTCGHWEWGYEGEGECLRFPQDFSGQLMDSTNLCDDYKPYVIKKVKL